MAIFVHKILFEALFWKINKIINEIFPQVELGYPYFWSMFWNKKHLQIALNLID